MNPLLRDFCAHQSWADAEHWRAIESACAGRRRLAIRTRLHHIHMVQRVFMWAVGDRSSGCRPRSPRTSDRWLNSKGYARESHHEIDRFLRGVTEAALDSRITMPWFGDPPLSITVTEALTQCAMHSHYHRGQNATRLRELDGEPPMTDLIVWYWKGRPAPAWS
jgi:uncharacterized damage-inducible protein DinB